MRIVELLPNERTLKQIEDLVGLWRASVAATHRFLTPERIDALAISVSGILRDVPHLLCARTEEGTCLGFAGTDDSLLDMLFVSPDYRGGGVGAALLSRCVHELGIRRLEVNEDNPAARAFYESHGFSVVGRSELDGMGYPYPVLYMEFAAYGGLDNTVVRLAADAGSASVLDEACLRELAAAGLDLIPTPEGLMLKKGDLRLVSSFLDMLPRIKQGALQRELLVRAAKVKGVEHPVAVDATAGLGQDSLLLAASGFTVHLYEADPVIAVLLADALHRASSDAVLKSVASRMHLHTEDSVAALRALDFEPDVVYLDPMFPGRTKSAAVKKKFQLLHHLERPCGNEEELLAAALSAHPRKVVVKRPVKGPFLAGVKPSHSLAGKAVRYDCIVPPCSEPSARG